MHDYNTIIGVIGLRNDKVSIPVIRKRYGIGCSGIQLILDRYKEFSLSWDDIIKMEPVQVIHMQMHVWTVSYTRRSALN